MSRPRRAGARSQERACVPRNSGGHSAGEEPPTAGVVRDVRSARLRRLGGGDGALHLTRGPGNDTVIHLIQLIRFAKTGARQSSPAPAAPMSYYRFGNPVEDEILCGIVG
jgi:hypothetical protein